MAKQSFPLEQLPNFPAIQVDKISDNTKILLQKNLEGIADLLQANQTYNWQNLIQPMEEMDDQLSKYWSPISHLQGVKETEELRQAYNSVLPDLTAYQTAISQNEVLFQAIESISKSPEFKQLSAAQRKIIENDLRDFKLSGINLDQDKKKRFAELEQAHSKLTTKFQENLLDATQSWHLQVTDETQLQGLPAQAKQLAIDNAKQRDLEGFVFTLDFPSYSTAIKFLENREIREKLYHAYVTRASDQGPNAGKWDNSEIIDEILKVRHEMAQLVGFDNFARYSLATKMAKEPDEVLQFLNDLLDKSLPMAKKELAEVAAYAKELDQLASLEAWDVAYYSEKLCQKEFQFNQEDLRPYFPTEHVLKGLFSIVKKLYGIEVKLENAIPTWHEQVQFYSLYDKDQTLRAGFYIDLYARKGKRDGAWMDECVNRRQLLTGNMQHPVAYLTCNFMPPVQDKPGLLTHDDVITLFHEFGHCLHHMLSKVDFAAVSGIHGVPWDAVEFPSQFMENFCWEKEVLQDLSNHYQTGEPLPEELFQKMLAAKHFQTGMQMVRQLEFSLFDFELHLNFDPKQKHSAPLVLNRIREKTSVLKPPAYNRFQNSFSHIFAGGYAAGYYSYKWAEVLSADAYSLFEEKGIFDQATGLSFMQNILEVGGSKDPMEAFVAFRGRKPKVDALLKHSGIK